MMNNKQFRSYHAKGLSLFLYDDGTLALTIGGSLKNGVTSASARTVTTVEAIRRALDELEKEVEASDE